MMYCRKDLNLAVSKKLGEWEAELRRRIASNTEEIDIITDRLKFLRDIVLNQIPDPSGSYSYHGFEFILEKSDVSIRSFKRRRNVVLIDLAVYLDGRWQRDVAELALEIPDSEDAKELFALREERKRKRRQIKKWRCELSEIRSKKREIKAKLI